MKTTKQTKRDYLEAIAEALRPLVDAELTEAQALVLATQHTYSVMPLEIVIRQVLDTKGPADVAVGDRWRAKHEVADAPEWMVVERGPGEEVTLERAGRTWEVAVVQRITTRGDLLRAYVRAEGHAGGLR